MKRMLLISEDELNQLVSEGIANAVTNITKKIARTAASRYNNNLMFAPPRPWGGPTPRVEDYGGFCGSSSGGCGSDDGGCGSGSRTAGAPKESQLLNQQEDILSRTAEKTSHQKATSPKAK
jgi:hypothetical protein